MIVVRPWRVPLEARREARGLAELYRYSGWFEIGFAADLANPGDPCVAGCKLYAKRSGAVLRYGVAHSPTYGCDLANVAEATVHATAPTRRATQLVLGTAVGMAAGAGTMLAGIGLGRLS